jgi:hypothetical protein
MNWFPLTILSSLPFSRRIASGLNGRQVCWSSAMRWRMFIIGLVGMLIMLCFVYYGTWLLWFYLIVVVAHAFFADRRPTSLNDRGRDSDDDDFRDRDYDVAALATNLSQAFQYGIYSNDDIEEVCECAKFLDLTPSILKLLSLLNFWVTFDHSSY